MCVCSPRASNRLQIPYKILTVIVFAVVPAILMIASDCSSSGSPVASVAVNQVFSPFSPACVCLLCVRLTLPCPTPCPACVCVCVFLLLLVVDDAVVRITRCPDFRSMPSLISLCRRLVSVSRSFPLLGSLSGPSFFFLISLCCAFVCRRRGGRPDVTVSPLLSLPSTHIWLIIIIIVLLLSSAVVVEQQGIRTDYSFTDRLFLSTFSLVRCLVFCYFFLL